MNTSPETHSETTGEALTENRIARRTGTLLAASAAIALAATSACKSNDEAPAPMASSASSTPSAAPVASAAPAVPTTVVKEDPAPAPVATAEKAQPPMSSAEYMNKWCTETAVGRADESGVNHQYAYYADQNKNTHAVELCGSQGAQEVVPVVCGDKIYVNAQIANGNVSYLLGDIARPARDAAKLRDKVLSSEAGMPTLLFKTKDGLTAQFPEGALVTNGVQVDKIPCAPATTTETRVARGFVSPDVSGLASRVTGLEGRLGKVEDTQKSAGEQLRALMLWQEGQKATKPGTCVDYATTPGDCRRLEETRGQAAVSAER